VVPAKRTPGRPNSLGRGLSPPGDGESYYASGPMTPWHVVSSVEAFTTPIFKLRRDRLRAPRNGSEHDFYVLEAADWVNVVAITPEQHVVLVRQYRHGSAAIGTEIPGGVVEPHEQPIEAARRELLEETGFAADDWTAIGVVEPNPAIQNNRTWTYLARGARRVADLDLDPAEEIEVDTVPLDRIPQMLRQGAISHALVLCAFAHLALHGGMMLGEEASSSTSSPGDRQAPGSTGRQRR